MHPDADEINIKFYPDGLPYFFVSQINHVFAIIDLMPQMIAWTNRLPDFPQTITEVLIPILSPVLFKLSLTLSEV